MHNQEKMKHTFPDVCIAGKGINVMHYYYYYFVPFFFAMKTKNILSSNDTLLLKQSVLFFWLSLTESLMIKRKYQIKYHEN